MEVVVFRRQLEISSKEEVVEKLNCEEAYLRQERWQDVPHP